MIIGVCTLEVMMYEVGSLKEKRQIIKSVIERIKGRYNVSIAEVGKQDKWQVAEIGFCCVSNEKKHADDMVNKVIKFMENDGRFEITHWDIETL